MQYGSLAIFHPAITQDSKTTSHGNLPGLDGYLCHWRLDGHAAL